MSTTRSTRFAGAAVLAALVGLLLLPSGSQAFTSSPVWKCRASALYSSIAGNNRVEPVVANGNPSTSNNKSPDRAQCATEEAGADNLATPLGIPVSVLGAQSASAKTTIEPELGRAIDQKVTAVSRVENLSLPLGTETVVIGAAAVDATATGSCVNNQPVLTGTSNVATLTLGGQPIDLNQLASGLQTLLEPLGVIVDVKFNEQVREGNALTVRAVHIKLLGGNAATPLADIVIAESKVEAEQFTCDPNKQIPGLDQQICPTGSSYNETTGLCIITVTGQNGETTRIIVVGRPFQGPSGGTVIPLDEARRRFGNKICLRGSGPQYAVIGTNGRDRITGTNGRDRILALGGNDSVAGGRGADCLDGGSGSDRMNGGIGSDRMIGHTGNDTLTGDLDGDTMTGGAGNDKVNGGPGADRMDGGAGRDIMNAGYGADRVTAGSGNDAINIANQGPRATVNCGGGSDKVRLNGKERRNLRGCEIQYVLKDR